MQLCELEDEQYVFREKDEADGLYVVLSGTCIVHRGRERSKKKDTTLATLGAASQFS